MFVEVKYSSVYVQQQGQQEQSQDMALNVFVC